MEIPELVAWFLRDKNAKIFSSIVESSLLSCGVDCGIYAVLTPNWVMRASSFNIVKIEYPSEVEYNWKIILGNWPNRSKLCAVSTPISPSFGPSDPFVISESCLLWHRIRSMQQKQWFSIGCHDVLSIFPSKLVQCFYHETIEHILEASKKYLSCQPWMNKLLGCFIGRVPFKI